MEKKKLLILQYELSAYNVPVYNEISDYYDLTVGYYLKDKSNQQCNFKKKHFEVTNLGPLVFVKGFFNYVKKYDIVSIIPDLHIVNYCLLPFFSRRYKVVNWSIGFRVSYKHPYITDRKHVLADRVFQSILSHCDASIFYMEKSKEFWKRTSLDMKRVFVAPNTTEVVPIVLEPEKKKNLLFVGTLYKGKGLDKLLASVKEVADKGYKDLRLTIVGDGECRKELEDYVAENGLKSNVTFTGAIFDEKVLANHFAEALLCISPTQGGLTCPKSMGYGVPFVTRKDAITGGEIYHITPGVNGIMYENDEELTSIIEDSCKNPQKYIEMGIAAKDYYDNHATIKHMAQGAMNAFEYALKRE
jgi:glycosyltransferase involved in cell wall biosynthesis